MVGAKLAIVGSSILTAPQSDNALWIVECILRSESPSLVISGGAEGIDTLAISVAVRGEFAWLVIPPDINRWASEGSLKGFKQRNMEVADACEELVCIRSIRSETYGSGWTADYAERLGKPVRRLYV